MSDPKLHTLLNQVVEELKRMNAIALAQLEMEMTGRHEKADSLILSADDQIKKTIDAQKQKIQEKTHG